MHTKRMVRRSLREIARVCEGVGSRAAAAADRLDETSIPAVSYPQNARFRDLHRGHRAFVIGNGPSLATQDLSPLQGELLFTMNAFDRHPLCRELRPAYHFLADPEVNENSPKQEAELARMGKGMPDSTMFVPAWPSIDSDTLRQWRATGRLFLVPIVGNLSLGPVTEFDMTTGLPAVQTVAQLALMTSVFMGCSPVYLMGVDSDWAASTDLDRHFYAERTLDESWDWQYESILEASLTMFRGYRFLWDFCRTRNVEIYNCTAGGLLDVFPRKRFEEVVADAGK